jgi:hypothetical protein
VAYRTEDALRSVKKYVAELLGAAPSPLAAVKHLPAVDDAAVAPLVTATTRVVHSDFGLSGAVVSFAWTDSTAIDMTGRIRVGRYQGAGWLRAVTMLANAPGYYLKPDGTMGLWSAVASPNDFDRHVFSKDVVAGTTSVSSAIWAANLAQPTRFATTWELLDGHGRTYRLAVVRTPTAPPSFAKVAADSLTDAAAWDTRFFHDRGEFEYPAAIVKAVGPTLTRNQGGYVELTQPLVVYAYPQPPDMAAKEPGEAQVAAERVRDLLVAGFSAGRALGRPLRIPLYDYDGLDYAEPSGQRQPYDFLRVVDASASVLPEPGDPRQVVVVADLRVSWRRGTDEDAPGSTGVVEEIRLTNTIT